MRRMGSLQRGHTISDVGTAPMTFAATATSKDTGHRTARRGLRGAIEGARGLPTRGRLLLGWCMSMHSIMHTLLPLWIDGLLTAEPHTV